MQIFQKWYNLYSHFCLFIFVKVSNLIFFNLTWKRNWNKTRNAPITRNMQWQIQWPGITNSLSLFSLFLHGHESEPGMWLLWPIEYCGSVAIPILSLVLKRTSSFCFCCWNPVAMEKKPRLFCWKEAMCRERQWGMRYQMEIEDQVWACPSWAQSPDDPPADCGQTSEPERDQQNFPANPKNFKK